MESVEHIEGYNLIKGLIPESYDSIKQASARTDGISGIPSGFSVLDKFTSGWQNGELITIGARASMGKTAFVISMLANMTVNEKIPAMLFSLEVNNKQLTNRFISNVCEISNEKIKSGQLADYEWQQLDYKLRDLLDAPLYVDTTPNLTIDELCTKAKEAVEKNGVRLIAIDYIQLLYADFEYTSNRYLELNYFTRRLKSLAKELDIPIIIVSQLNRELEKRDYFYESCQPKLTDLRDSGTICDDSDVVCFIHRPEYYQIYTSNDGTDLRGMAEIIIAKQRSGATGGGMLRFHKEISRFDNIDDMLIEV